MNKIKEEYNYYIEAQKKGEIIQFKPSLRADDLGYPYVDIYYPIEQYDIRLLRIKPKKE